MKTFLKHSLFLLLLLGTLASPAGEKLAVAEPVGGAGVSKDEIASFWSMLESSVGSGYELISRSALKQIMTEAGLSQTSGLVSPDGDAASLGRLKGVQYLLTSRISKFGRRYSISLMVIHASEGTVDPAKKVAETVDSMDDLADKLPDLLQQAGLGMPARKYGVILCLDPVIRVPNPPHFLASDYAAELEAFLIAGKVKIRVLKNIGVLLRKNGVNDLASADPALYMRIGKVLRADTLIESYITRFEFNVKKVYVAASKRTATRTIGSFEGNIRVISVQDGTVISSFPFRIQEDLSELDANMTENWNLSDYGKYLIRKMVPEIAKPLLKTLR